MEDGSRENGQGIQEWRKSGRCRDVKNTENLDEAGGPNCEQHSSSLLLSSVSPQVECKDWQYEQLERIRTGDRIEGKG